MGANQSPAQGTIGRSDLFQPQIFDPSAPFDDADRQPAPSVRPAAAWCAQNHLVDQYC